ncbi:hypothetical protein VR45_28790 [Streptomyces sp. NRRL S-495]|nr:hypothetical protein VR45_28790 [Streptomyces sp. NRRL S-495]
MAEDLAEVVAGGEQAPLAAGAVLAAQEEPAAVPAGHDLSEDGFDVSVPQASWRSRAASRSVSEQWPASTRACLGWRPVFRAGLVEHRGAVQRVGGVGHHVGGGDDLVGLVHDGPGVVDLDAGAVAVLDDPRVGVGEVGLGLRFRPGLGGVDDGLLVAGAGALPAAAFLALGVAAGLVGGLGLDLERS